MLDLAAPRVLAIQDRKRVYRLTVNRITKKAWLRYFEGIVSTSENQGGKEIHSFDSSSARLELLESALVSAEGYATQDDAPISSVRDWKGLLPLSHRLAAAEQLVNVTRAEPLESDAITLGFETVYLDAVWSAAEDGTMMTKHLNLAHQFGPPSVEQQRRYSRSSTRSMVLGGSRKGKTQWLGAQPTLVELYDELVLTVGGYSLKGEPLESSQIVEEMDTYHKVAAAGILFSSAEANVQEE
jgi:hypothetical protein